MPWKPPLTSKSAHSSFSQVECRERGMGSGDLAFLLASQMTWVCKTHYHPFHLSLESSDLLGPILCVLNFSPLFWVLFYLLRFIPLLRFMVNGLFLPMTFSSMPIRQIQWGKFREFVSPITFRSGCAVEHRHKTDSSRWAASPGRSLSQWRDSRDGERHPHTCTSVWEQHRELNRAVCEWI